MTEKENTVYKILLTPIKCDKNIPKICLKDNVIYSHSYIKVLRMKTCQILVWVSIK